MGITAAEQWMWDSDLCVKQPSRHLDSLDLVSTLARVQHTHTRPLHQNSCASWALGDSPCQGSTVIARSSQTKMYLLLMSRHSKLWHAGHGLGVLFAPSVTFSLSLSQSNAITWEVFCYKAGACHEAECVVKKSWRGVEVCILCGRQTGQLANPNRYQLHARPRCISRGLHLVFNGAMPGKVGKDLREA